MFKSKLQEECQRKGWGLPEYTTTRTGPDHCARFTASAKINIKGGELVFRTPNQCTSSKLAQNIAAQLAFDHITNATLTPNPNPIPIPNPNIIANNSAVYPVPPLPNSLPTPSAGLVTHTVRTEGGGAANTGKNTGNMEMSQNGQATPSTGLVTNTVRSGGGDANIGKKTGNMEMAQTGQDSACYRVSIGALDRASKDTLHMYKNRLQHYGQKNNLGFPVYAAESEGPPHNRRFKSRVSLDGKFYETLEFFTTLKEAEQAAAKVACQILSVDANKEDGGMYKNILQELAQKMNLPCPSYETASCGMSHRPVFVSSVEVGSDTFRGGEAFTKKLAEMNAAKVAYLALTARCQAKDSSTASIAVTQSNQPSDVVKQDRQNATYEEVQAHAKKLKSWDRIENTHSPGPSNVDPSLQFYLRSENSTALPVGPFKEQPVIVEDQTLPLVKTVVFPRDLNLPVPENATMMPYSDERFVAYRAGVSKPSA